MRIIFVRHGHPNYRQDCLTEMGHLHAEAAAERLKDEPIRRICASSHGRAVETAEHIAARHGLPVEKYDFIREIGWGSIDGEPVPHKGHPWTIIDEWIANGRSLMNPGWAQEDEFRRNQVVGFVERIGAGMDEWLSMLGYDREGDLYRVREKNDDTVVLASHAGASCAAMARMFNLPFPFALYSISASYTAVTIVKLEGETGALTAPRFELMNDDRHIRGIEVQNVYGR
jgi:probable phosphoglycerate mutase